MVGSVWNIGVVLRDHFILLSRESEDAEEECVQEQVSRQGLLLRWYCSGVRSWRRDSAVKQETMKMVF